MSSLGPGVAGSGLRAVRELNTLQLLLESSLLWQLKPSVGSWYQAPLGFPGYLPPSDHHRGLPAVEEHQRVPPWMWCVSLVGFRYFICKVWEAQSENLIPNKPNPRTGKVNPNHDDPEVGPNMHAVNEYVIIPHTKRNGGKSWALMLEPEGLPIGFFVSHSWNEGVYEFARKVEYSWPADWSMWCCFLANPQAWAHDDLQKLLGQAPDLSDSPFMRALTAGSLRRFLIVPNSAESLYCRLWCVAELVVAMKIEAESGQPFIDIARDPLPKATTRRMENIRALLAKSTCSDKFDLDRIRSFIGGREQEIEEMIYALADGRRSIGKQEEGAEVPPARPAPLEAPDDVELITCVVKHGSKRVPPRVRKANRTHEVCKNSCGRSAFWPFGTCCTRCRGSDGPHTGDCIDKDNLNKKTIQSQSALTASVTEASSHVPPTLKKANGTHEPCKNTCGRPAFSPFDTCCTKCRGGAGPHTVDCLGKEACKNSCGRPAFSSFDTCCTKCRGSDGPHAADCFKKDTLRKKEVQPPPAMTGSVTRAASSMGCDFVDITKPSKTEKRPGRGGRRLLVKEEVHGDAFSSTSAASEIGPSAVGKDEAQDDSSCDGSAFAFDMLKI